MHTALPFLLLGVSICAVWAPAIAAGPGKSWPAWPFLFFAAIIWGMAASRLATPAAASLATLALLAWASQSLGGARFRTLCTALSAMLAFALALHLVPGFANLSVASGVRLSADAKPMSLSANFDKGAAGLVLLAFFSRRTASLREWKSICIPTLVAALVTTMAVIGTALAIGYVKFEPKLPLVTPAFLAVNLLFVCVMEEAFFRGLLQERLIQAVGRRPGLSWVPVAVSAALFGLVHAPGGPALMGLATLTGLGCSITYARSRRIEAPVAVHFTVNAVHFLLFTYPALAR